MLIKPETIREVKNRIKIYDVIAERVILNGVGNRYKGRCPFHEDSSPSLSVSIEENLYNCFGCNSGGDAIRFVQKFDKLSFSETIIKLAQDVGVKVEAEDIEKQKEYEKTQSEKSIIYEILAVTAHFYQSQLKANINTQQITEFIKNRGLTQASIDDFGLGYADDRRDALYQHLLNKLPEYQDYYVKAGVVCASKYVSASETAFDFFRNRIIIPLKDVQGRIIGFGGRALTDSPDTPKYLNSPQSEIFDKSNFVFGLNIAKDTVKTVRPLNYFILTEGYFDVIMLHQAGFKNAVAFLGTALTPQQIKAITRYSNIIYLNLDNDYAGVAATKKLIKSLSYELKNDLIDLRVILLESKDASDFINRYGKDSYSKFIERVNAAKNWIDWLAYDIIGFKNLEDNKIWKDVFRELIEVAKLLNDFEKIKYIQFFSELLSAGNHNIQPDIYDMFINKLKMNSISSTHKTRTAVKSNTDDLTANSEEMILKIYLHCPHYRVSVRNQIQLRNVYFCISKNRNLWIDICEIEPEPRSDDEFKNFKPNPSLVDILVGKYKDTFYEDYLVLSPGETEVIKKSYHESFMLALNHIERKMLIQRLDNSYNMWKENKSDVYLNIYQEYYKKYKDLNKN